ncbi:MAG: hypothetical protein DDT23_00339 [candidate division WS2 bacterium]|nr:hypothetical protein [Candidatus Lithacetigena glycinireducens]
MKEYIKDKLLEISADIKEIKENLKEINSRVRTNITDIELLKERDKVIFADIDSNKKEVKNLGEEVKIVADKVLNWRAVMWLLAICTTLATATSSVVIFLSRLIGG